MDCSTPGFPVYHHLPQICSDSCPLSQWCHPTFSPSVIPFSSCPQSFPASESFPMSQLFRSGGQSIGVSASASVHQRTPRTDLLLDGLVGSPCSPRDSQESSLAAQLESIKFSAFFMVQLSHPYMTAGKIIALTIRTFVNKVMSLLFNMLSSFVIAFLPRSKCLNFMATVTFCSDFQAQNNKICHRETNANIQGWGEADI